MDAGNTQIPNTFPFPRENKPIPEGNLGSGRTLGKFGSQGLTLVCV